MRLYVFGNGNLSFSTFLALYVPALMLLSMRTTQFLVCDYMGADTLTMEFLKDRAADVRIFHMKENPRYVPVTYRTKASAWVRVGGFEDDKSRDEAAIQECTHFLAFDFNSDDKRKSGTQRNIERCLSLGRVSLGDV
jgi:hypothetical protein